MAMTQAERSDKCRSNKNMNGLVRKEYWNTPEHQVILKEVSERLKTGGNLFKDRIMIALLGNDHYGEG